MKKFLIILLSIIVALSLLVTIGGSFYMVHFALSPNPERTDTAARFALLFKEHPEVRPWVDSLRAEGALRDTFVTMPSGERHHAFYIRSANQGNVSLADGTQATDTLNVSPQPRVAICIHGWRNQAIGLFKVARIYHRMLGCNILLPDLHAHGLSEGEAIGMGWHERKDILHWMTVASELFDTHDFIVHGISMGAATTMNVSGEPMPECVERIRFIEDCGYTSVWDEFQYNLHDMFGIPTFPILYTSSLLCRLKYGWSFSEATPLEQVKNCPYPMLFIHGDNDHFVPSWMVHPLYKAKPATKDIWITAGSEHDRSYTDYPEDYAKRIIDWAKPH